MRVFYIFAVSILSVVMAFDWEKIREICGQSNEDRIIGGSAAKIGQFPWIAHIGILRREGDNATLRFVGNF
jgi:hypothetical protein